MRSLTLPAGASPSRAEASAREVRRGEGTIAVFLMAVALAVAAFAFHCGLARQFDHLRTFAQYDVLFDADPNIRLTGFSHGWNAFNRNLMHPNLANFVNPPLRGVAAAMRLTGAADGDPLLFRRQLGLLVSPLAAALQVAALLVLFLRLGLPLFPAALLTVLGGISFSQIIFGSVPDHFVLSNLILTIAFILAADLLRDGRLRWWWWGGVAWAAAGVTLTNLVIVGLVFWVALLASRRQFAAPTRQAAILVAAAGFATLVSFHLLNLGYDADPQPADDTVVWTGHFWREHIPTNLARFPTAVADSLAPPEPQINRIRYLWPRGSKYRFQFTLERGPALLTVRNPLGTVMFLALLAGAAASLRAGPTRRGLALGALAVLAFNGLFHAVWGNEFFLYSQHWLVAALVLLAGLVPERPRVRAAVCAGLALLVAVVALNNLLNLRLVLAVLATYPG
jgi:hypothetical protein